MNFVGDRGTNLSALLLLFTAMLTGCAGGNGTSPTRTATGNSGPSGTVSVGPGGTSSTSTPPAHTLTVQASPATGGTIKSNPAAIACPGTCSASFVGGTSIALTVAPAQGFAFSGWGGACSGAGACNVTLNSDQAVTANFAPPPPQPVTLSVASAGNGTGTVTSSPAAINCGATCSAQVSSGTTVTLTAVADPGSVFAGWSAAQCTGTNTCALLMNSDNAIVANFALLIPVGVTLSGTGTGSVVSVPAGINCPTSACTASFGSGTSVSLQATPGPGSVFTAWTGACTGTSTCTVTLSGNQPAAVGARFDPAPPPTYTLSITNSGAGTGTVTSNPSGINCGTACTAALTAGTTVILTAAASPGSVFAGWSGFPCTGTGTCTVALNANTAVTATFIPLVTLGVTLGGTGSGSVSSSPAGITCGATCSASFGAGTVVSLAATPAAGSVFTGWAGLAPAQALAM